MGVDWYACERCGDTYPDCGDYFCCGCEVNFCSDECGERDDSDDKVTCVVCRGEYATDTQVMAYLLGEIGISEDEAMARCIAARKAGG